jgi:hypothetical protein
MFGPTSHPIALANDTVDLEKEARDYHAAFILRGLKAKGRQKTFRDMILERPKNPYATRATETLAMVIDENPIQNHGSFGVLVSEETLMTGNTAVFVRLDLPEGGEAGAYVYSDMSCTIAVPSESKDRVRAVTLPFRIRTAQIRRRGSDQVLKVSAKTGHRVNQYGIFIQEGSAPGRKFDKQSPAHADFVSDLSIEIEAVLHQMAQEGPVYQIRPAKIQTSEKDIRGGLRVPVGVCMSTEMSEDLLGWMTRSGVSCFDVHLPYVDLTVDQIIAVRALADTTARLAWARAGLSAKAISASLLIESGNPISGDQVAFAIRKSTHDFLSDHMEEIFADEEASEDYGFEKMPVIKERPSDEELHMFLVTFRDLFMKIAKHVSLHGYQYLFLKGSVGSWIPFILAEIRLTDLASEDTEATLAARYEFQMSRIKAIAMA